MIFAVQISKVHFFFSVSSLFQCFLYLNLFKIYILVFNLTGYKGWWSWGQSFCPTQEEASGHGFGRNFITLLEESGYNLTAVGLTGSGWSSFIWYKLHYKSVPYMKPVTLLKKFWRYKSTDCITFWFCNKLVVLFYRF
jgi:hypothetical protein